MINLFLETQKCIERINKAFDEFNHCTNPEMQYDDIIDFPMMYLAKAICQDTGAIDDKDTWAHDLVKYLNIMCK